MLTSQGVGDTFLCLPGTVARQKGENSRTSRLEGLHRIESDDETRTSAFSRRNRDEDNRANDIYTNKANDTCEISKNSEAA